MFSIFEECTSLLLSFKGTLRVQTMCVCVTVCVCVYYSLC